MKQRGSVEVEPEVIVIGSGLGGLTAAACLAAAGRRVLVLEQYDVAGGASQTFRRKRMWQFDVGLHYIGGVRRGEIGRILGGLGLADRIEFTELDPDGFDTLVFPDFTFRVPKGWDAYRERLLDTFPDEAEGLGRAVDTMRSVIEELRRVGVPGEGTDLERYLELAPTVVAWAMRSLTELFDECDLGERSRAVLTGQAGDYATPPSRTPVGLHAGVIDHYLKEGAFYVSGGGQVIAGHLIDVIHSNGGRVRTHAEVTTIETAPPPTPGAGSPGNENPATASQAASADNPHRVTGVTLADGERFEAPAVIATGDLKRTFGELFAPEVMPGKFVDRVAGYRMATPLATVYLGLDFEITERMGATNFWIHPRYDSERYYDAVAAGELDPTPPVYVSSASAKDPDGPHHAPPGCSTVELMTWTTGDPSAWGVDPGSDLRYSKQPGYRQKKQELIDRLIEGAEPVLGELRSHILWQEAATPLTHARYTMASEGSCYGIELATDQFGPLRPATRTPIGGLFLAGASARRGHGIAGVMVGGVDAAGAVLGRDLFREFAAGEVLGDPSLLTAGGEGWDPLDACRRLQDKSRRELHHHAWTTRTSWPGSELN